MSKKQYWSKETPTKEGWYWCKYKNKRNTYTVCPCTVIHVSDATIVNSARNDVWLEGPNHGGKGLKYAGKLDESLRFGAFIEEPSI